MSLKRCDTKLSPDEDYCTDTEEFDIENNEESCLSNMVTFDIAEHNADVDLASQAIIRNINKMAIPKEVQLELINTVVKTFHRFLYILD